MPTFEIKYAPFAFKFLNGYFCVYKPKLWTFHKLRVTLINKLIKELNSMKVREARDKVFIEGSLSENNLSVDVKPAFCDHPLVVGKRYQEKDIRLEIVNYPGHFASGVVVATMGNKTYLAREIRNQQYLRVYEVKGRFGLATDDFLETGKIIENSTFKHVTQFHLSRVISKFQSTQQITMYKTMGIDLQSETAYQLASKGLIRPKQRKTTPIVYGVRLVHFDLPDFTVHVQCINEFQPFLAGLINDIGLKMKTNALCTQIRLLKYGPFTVDHSLLDKHCNIENIIKNIRLCKTLLPYKKIKQYSANLVDVNKDESQESFFEMLKAKI